MASSTRMNTGTAAASRTACVANRFRLYGRIALLSAGRSMSSMHAGGAARSAGGNPQTQRATRFDPALVRRLREDASKPAESGRAWTPSIWRSEVGLGAAAGSTQRDRSTMSTSMRSSKASRKMIDAKSPSPAGHSERVALFTDLIAEQLGLRSPNRRRWLQARRACFTTSASSGSATPCSTSRESSMTMNGSRCAITRRYTERILSGIAPLRELARIAGAHHEKLDGIGYPRGLKAPDIALETRIITTADIFDAISADRPYRAAIPVSQALTIMAGMVGAALNPDCFAALRRAMGVIDMKLVA